MNIQIEEAIGYKQLEAINEIVLLSKRHTDLTVLHESLKYIKEIFPKMFKELEIHKDKGRIVIVDAFTKVRILVIS